MNYYRDHKNDEEKHVVEQAAENVDFLGKQLLCVDFIENLEHHIHIEEEGIVAGHSRVPFNFHVSCDHFIVWNRKNSRIGTILVVFGFGSTHIGNNISAFIECSIVSTCQYRSKAAIFGLHLCEPTAIFSGFDEVEGAGVVVAEVEQKTVE